MGDYLFFLTIGLLQDLPLTFPHGVDYFWLLWHDLDSSVTRRRYPLGLRMRECDIRGFSRRDVLSHIEGAGFAGLASLLP